MLFDQALSMFHVPLVIRELFNVKLHSLHLFDPLVAAIQFLLELRILLAFCKLCALSLLKGMVETLIGHAVETELVATFVVRAAHVETAAVLEDWGFALRASLCKQLHPLL
jgi:hypothetical protein